eukprot:CAMPEP_0197483338 /NCGR_PEP_ID=MMETSP1309-20131121/56828_1 /TAXON_ID=464262 /ORGANISM="Genus nov. species nov., Strain RCC998" /LENGTH=132 /DNA_ID=CAMNT_0043025937 /DNA_START=297 /DNA_END=695 /DNA_ORIENTATION=-
MAGLSENEALDAIDDEEREIAARETYAEEKHEPSKGVQDLVRKVSESITEITEQHRKPRKRARRPESVDWTGEDGKDERVSESITEITEQHRKPRKRARRPESVDWTGEGEWRRGDENQLITEKRVSCLLTN